MCRFAGGPVRYPQAEASSEQNRQKFSSIQFSFYFDSFDSSLLLLEVPLEFGAESRTSCRGRPGNPAKPVQVKSRRGETGQRRVDYASAAARFSSSIFILFLPISSVRHRIRIAICASVATGC